MGWSYEFNNQNLTPKQFWKRVLIPRYENWGNKILKENSKGKEFYAAIQNNKGEIFGLVTLIERHNNEICYKYIDEASGPFYYNASKSLIKLLTPTTSVYANEWRQKCFYK